MIEEIKHLAKVNVTICNQTKFGLIWKRTDTEGIVLPGSAGIIDCVKPTTYIIERDNIFQVEQNDDGLDEYDMFVQEQYVAAQKLSDSIDGVKIGKLLKIAVNDNCWSYYVITKITGTYCSIEWRGFDPARRVHPRLQWEYRMSYSECLRCIEIDEYLSKMLSWNPL